MRKVVLSALTAAALASALAVGTARSADPGPPPPPPPPGGYPTLTPPCPPTGCPTNTPTITPTPTPTVIPTSTPIPTATPVPLTVQLVLGHGMVVPRKKQKITVTTVAGASVSIRVKFPNGDTKTHTGTANGNGDLSWSYVQFGSRITHGSRKARVTVSVSNAPGTIVGATASASRSYTIGFALVDVSIEPRKQKRGQAVSVWVHTGANTAVKTVLLFPHQVKQTLAGRSGKDGWWYAKATLAKNAPKGTVHVRGYATVQRKTVYGESSFRVT